LTLKSQDIVWSHAYGSASDPKQKSWFFVVKRPATDWAFARLGDEGQKMDRMTVQEYADHPQNIPHFSDRLRDYFATL
ncbi:MAG: DNA mismatch repair protein MutT, partial [Planktomarina sp.]